MLPINHAALGDLSAAAEQLEAAVQGHCLEFADDLQLSGAANGEQHILSRALAQCPVDNASMMVQEPDRQRRQDAKIASVTPRSCLVKSVSQHSRGGGLHHTGTAVPCAPASTSVEGPAGAPAPAVGSVSFATPPPLDEKRVRHTLAESHSIPLSYLRNLLAAARGA